MKFIRYSRFTGEDFGISSEDLLRALSQYFLRSGFEGYDHPFSDLNEQTLEQLREAIREALENGDLFNEEKLEEMLNEVLEGESS